jgi:hypothetical protein
MATAKKPAAKKKAVKRPAAKKTAAKKTVAKKAVAKKAVVKEPAAKEPIAKEPAAKKITAKKIVDYTLLLQLIESGKHQAEIMKEFAFKTAAQFKNHYLSALMKAGKAPEIKTSRSSKKSAPAKEAFVSKRGSVVIAKGLIEEMGFAVGSTFTVRKTKAGISLKRMS